MSPHRASVHPHACGEHSSFSVSSSISFGSSPRMWGTLSLPNPLTGKTRFIPTHVGNTLRGRLGAGVVAVHPHACGEHASGAGILPAAIGSSPRMWGTPLQSHLQRVQTRFIPTHVGNTRAILTLWLYRSVHPHACGEHLMKRKERINLTGSSPRMWGTLGLYGAANQPGRFIPTHVGNTPGGRLRSRFVPVHPHACGEHLAICLVSSSNFGSSPRMWGTHPHLA